LSMGGGVIPSKWLVQPTRPWSGPIPTAAGRLLDGRSWNQDSTPPDHRGAAP
jgi:hypothetical protein